MLKNIPIISLKIGTFIGTIEYLKKHNFTYSENANSRIGWPIKVSFCDPSEARASDDTDKVKAAEKEYNTFIRPQIIKVTNICRIYTKTNCVDAIELIPFLEKYLETKSQKNPFIEDNKSSSEDVLDSAEKMKIERQLIISKKNYNEYELIENYRKSELDFWNNKIIKENLPIGLFTYPNQREIVDFATFHWAIFMASESIKGPEYYEKEPEIYNKILETFEKRRMTKAEEYRDILRKEFSRFYESFRKEK